MHIFNLMKLTLFIAIVILAIVSGCSDNEKFPAPLGLKWGMTKTEIEQAGVELVECKANAFFVSCELINVPQPINYIDRYWLGFINDELHSVSMVGKPEHRNQKVELLIDKYGWPDRFDSEITVWYRHTKPIDTGIIVGKYIYGFNVSYYTTEFQQHDKKCRAAQDVKSE